MMKLNVLCLLHKTTNRKRQSASTSHLESRDSIARDERGAAFVEAAFALPLFILIILGIIGWGYFFTKHVILNYAAPFAARCAAIQSSSDSLNYCGIYNLSGGTYKSYGARASMGFVTATSFNATYPSRNGNTYLCVLSTAENPLGFLGAINFPVGQGTVSLALPLVDSSSFCSPT
jgi:Flp pilus assembly protein TadG